MDLYDFLNENGGFGCTTCPFINECDEGGGYTIMDEYGTCPVENINTQEDLEKSKFPNL